MSNKKKVTPLSDLGEFGLINHLLVSLGLLNEGIPWLAKPNTAMAAVAPADSARFTFSPVLVSEASS